MEKFINIDKIIKSKNERLYKWLPQFVINYIKKTVHEESVNSILYENKNLYNEEFCNEIVSRFNLNVITHGLENIPQKGPIILASNHPLGGMDAMAVVSGLSKRRKDIQFIVNDILLNIKNLKGLFVGVNKHGKSSKDSFNNVNKLFASDKAVFIFPAGLVSRKKKGVIVDLIWKKTFVLKAREHQTPIIPIFIDGKLSKSFYRLANFREKIGIKANLEMFYLVNEQYKLKNSTINITIGKPLYPKDFDSSKTDFEIAQWIKEKVYTLNK